MAVDHPQDLDRRSSKLIVGLRAGGSARPSSRVGSSPTVTAAICSAESVLGNRRTPILAPSPRRSVSLDGMGETSSN